MPVRSVRPPSRSRGDGRKNQSVVDGMQFVSPPCEEVPLQRRGQRYLEEAC